MPQGLQCWNSSGVMILDLTDRITRTFGKVSIPANGSGYITDANFATGTIWWQVLQTSNSGAGVPTMAADPANNRISYAPQSGVPTTVACDVIYGVY